jgi:hypothetical protein
MLLDDYRQSLRTTIGSSAAPYGYTLTVWTSGAVLTNARGLPNTIAALTFMVGAVLGFAFVGVLAFGSVARRFDRGHGAPPLVWGSFHFFSVGLAIGSAALVAYYVQDFVVWPLGGFLATTVYLLVAGAESTVAYEWDHRREK